MDRKIQRQLTDVATSTGATAAWVYGGKHVQLAITLRGNTRRVFMSVTPSDARAIKNISADIKRCLRTLDELEPAHATA